jgi:hypothetical protein
MVRVREEVRRAIEAARCSVYCGCDCIDDRSRRAAGRFQTIADEVVPSNRGMRMNRLTTRVLSFTAAMAWLATALTAAPPTAELKAKLQEKAKEIRWMSTDPKVVAAVREHNASLSAEAKAMTQEKWKSLPVLDPFVRALSKNALAEYLKSKRDPDISELFVSGSDGTKVALFNKTTNWSHKGKEKYEVPMAGKTYIGPVELDESTGVEQVQIGIPVLDGGKPIGSVVVGFEVAKLK